MADEVSIDQCLVIISPIQMTDWFFSNCAWSNRAMELSVAKDHELPLEMYVLFYEIYRSHYLIIVQSSQRDNILQ